MDENVKEKWLEAGRINAEAKDVARKAAQPGATLLDIAEEIEAFIRDQGAKPAFPTNIAVNEEAAHFTPSRTTDTVLGEDDVVKIDIGVQIDGYVGDSAITLNPSGNHHDLIDAANACLEAVMETLRPGITIGEIGDLICTAAEEHGVKPVSNLGGHYIKQYVQHADPSIPNARTNNPHTINPGDVFAVEPFVTTGAGKVKEGRPGNIYKFDGGNTRNRFARQALREIKKEFKTLPFTSRWMNTVQGAKLKMALRNLEKSGVIHGYGVLTEVENGLVAQSEHTFLMEEDGVIVTTR